MKKKFLVTAQWDDEVAMWVATSDDIPGLVTEAKSIDELVRRVKAVAPELIEDNLRERDGLDDLIDLCVQSSFSLHGASAH